MVVSHSYCSAWPWTGHYHRKKQIHADWIVTFGTIRANAGVFTANQNAEVKMTCINRMNLKHEDMVRCFSSQNVSEETVLCGTGEAVREFCLGSYWSASFFHQAEANFGVTAECFPQVQPSLVYPQVVVRSLHVNTLLTNLFPAFLVLLVCGLY